MNPIPRFYFSKSVTMMQKIRRYSWQDIETASANILSPTVSDQQEGVDRLEKIKEVVRSLYESYLSGRPYDMDGPLEFLNSDYIVFLYMKEHSHGLDEFLSRLREDHLHKLDFAFMRLHTGFLPVTEYGRVPVEVLTLQFLTKCSIWKRYEQESEDGNDYDLKKALLKRRLPPSFVNRLFFSQNSTDAPQCGSLCDRYWTGF